MLVSLVEDVVVLDVLLLAGHETHLVLGEGEEKGRENSNPFSKKKKKTLLPLDHNFPYFSYLF